METKKAYRTEENNDCRGYCLNLYMDKEDTNMFAEKTNMFVDERIYRCSLTERRCVGSKKRKFFRNKVNKLIPEIIGRCPSRKTIEDILKKSTEPQLPAQHP